MTKPKKPEDVQTEAVEVTFSITKAQLEEMAREAVAHRMNVKRVVADDDDQYADKDGYTYVDSSTLNSFLKQAARERINEAAPALIEKTILDAINEQVTKGFASTDGYGNPRGTPKSLNQLIQEAFNREVRTGNSYNSRSVSLVESVVSERVIESMNKVLDKELEAMRAEFRKALTGKFTEAAAEALRRAVMDGR